MKTEKIIENTKSHLSEILEELTSVRIIESQTLKLNSTQYRNSKDVSVSLSSLKNKSNPIIYVIELVDLEKKAELFNNFNEFWIGNIVKTKNKDRVNISRNMKTGSGTLYVGSSTTNFISRIKNHLGVRGNRVYSLHLCKWDQNLIYNINIKCFEVVSSKESKINSYIIELIEQQIWDHLQPNFGKRSGLL